MFNLRPYQNRAVDGARDSYVRGLRAPLIVVPTGGGKTIIFSHIANTTSQKGKRVLVLVHRIELVRQTVSKLMWAGVKVGVIHPDYTPDYNAPVQVASVQTLVKRIGKINLDFDLIIVDEAHHAVAGSWRKIIDAYPNARVLGVTATPCRADGTGLNEIFDDIIIGPSVAELIEDGFLVKPLVYAPAKRLDLSGIKIKMGDYDAKEIEMRVDKPSITGDAVAHYKRICPGVPAVAFCVSVAHAQHVASEFQASGFNFYAVDGGMVDDLRSALLNGLSGQHTEKELKVLRANNIALPIHGITSCSIISEGTDIPAIGAAILLRPTASLSLYIQQVGRALRPLPGKSHAIVLDHVGNCYTHGWPDDDREWSLGGEKKRRGKTKEKSIKVKQCDQCFGIHKPAPVCPNCGYEYPVSARELEVEDGELEAVTPEMKAAITKQRKVEVAKAKSLDDLIAIEKSRGYKSGWARHVWGSRNKRATGI